VLREEPFVVLTHASRSAHILAQQPFLRLDRKVYAGQLVDEYLRKAGIRPKERLKLDGLELIAVMVDRSAPARVAVGRPLKVGATQHALTAQ